MNEKKRSIIFIVMSVLLLLGSVIAASLCRWLLLFTFLLPIFGLWWMSIIMMSHTSRPREMQKLFSRFLSLGC